MSQTQSTSLVLATFAAVYVGMALGRWPGLKIDRTGIALLGAIVLYASGVVSAAMVFEAIEFPTLIILFGLMVLSAQFAACGFYDWCSARIAATHASPAAILALTVAVAGFMSAILVNDVVVFAMTPMLIKGLLRRGLDPRPYLIALAGAANAGSAATVIGNPQNILIGQVGRLDFWGFVAVCGPPALLALVTVFAVVWLVWRKRLSRATAENSVEVPPVDGFGLGKGILATLVLLALFTTRLPHVADVLVVTAALLVSRRLATREILGLVDWHLLVLFGGLFVVTFALAQTELPGLAFAALAAAGIDFKQPAVMALTMLVGSNVIGNVPIVVLLLAILKDLPAETLYALAVLSTLAGNLLIVGSVANIIVAERAKDSGVILGFAEHAKCGIPITLLSLGLALGWFWARTAIGV
ncbi:MAG TPA: SLC13 family permease [Xanthobacteraceae bacterium]|nr:SLC13 family permease [Xanthobacteraceae bacterium]